MSNLQSYLYRLPPKLQNKGKSTDGEIELLQPSTSIAADEGIVYEDQYIMVLRDPVLFPSGKNGHYLRIVEKALLAEGVSGTVIVPKSTGYVYFIRIFRHATRSWEWELPRGFQELGLTPAENAKKETFEEIGVMPIEIVKIGTIKPNTGILANEAYVFLAVLDDSAVSQVVGQKQEAIQEVAAIPVAELANFLVNNVTCGFSLGAILQACLHGFLKL